MSRKILLTVLFLTAAMLALPILTVSAKSPIIEVSGTIKSSSTALPILIREVGGNRFLFIRTASNWTGSIVGNTVGSQTWIIHMGGNQETNHTFVNAEIFFMTATVHGRTGTMTVQLLNLAWSGAPEKTHGYWRIQSASGGLEGLQGGGEWITGVGVNRYEGTIHWTR